MDRKRKQQWESEDPPRSKKSHISDAGGDGGGVSYAPQQMFKSLSDASTDSDSSSSVGSPPPVLYTPMGASMGASMGATVVSTKPAPESSSSGYSSIAQNMMAKMGYKKGTGLGKLGKGRVEIVEASKQRGRRGLGLKTKGFEPSSEVVWTGDEEISSKETVEWMEPSQGILTSAEIEEWKVLWDAQKPKLTIDDETEFCDETLLKTLLDQKTTFDLLDGEEMRQARTRSNPHETIRGGIFLNRAAMKMANMDFVCDYMFTSPKHPDGTPVVKDNELLYFADACAGPGGFSEYVVWRRTQSRQKKDFKVKGFGFTLKGSNDFKLEDFYSAPPEFFEPHYGVNGSEGDGDATNSDNQREFRRFVMEHTGGKGVHFVMADGGFSVAGQENIQEILTKQLLLCQFLVAMSIVREGGHFVCKTFDLFTPFSVGLIYVLYRSFEQVSIFKPVTSRPANSERYVICKGRRSGTDPTHDFLFDLNETLNMLKSSKQDVLESVPLDVLRADDAFMDYIIEQNERQAETQTQALAKIQAYVQNSDLIEMEQKRMRDECLALWGIPGRSRAAPKVPDPATKFDDLCQEDQGDYGYFCRRAMPLDKETFAQKVKSVYDYRCTVAAGERYFVLGIGRSYVYFWDGKNQPPRWRKVDRCKLQLPGGTLFEAELIEELKGEGSGQRRMLTAHIVDAMWLAGQDIHSLPYSERLQRISLFVKAVDRPTRSDLTPLRVKEVFRCQDVTEIMERLVMLVVKGGGRNRRLCYRTDNGRHYMPQGIFFIKTCNDPWTVQWSRSQRRLYFFNTSNRKSVFEYPPESIASFKACRIHRLLWAWEEGIRLHDLQEMREEPNKLSKDMVLDHIKKQRVVL
ncbi:cap-specific mRNA (nucleoside-2'-O-)-methyltransferase 1-like [Lytechinus pictus]|uniref:cap-specific mRNA (nucleoside-2'-O-)-methyltransferase 1-like n=1 Tax=Lytechinus pictus TaxID=7653 RepID=UPI0030BA0853